MSSKKNKKITLWLKVIFVFAILAVTLSTVMSMYRASRQYEQVKDCINKGGAVKDCDIQVYGEPKEKIGGLR